MNRTLLLGFIWIAFVTGFSVIFLGQGNHSLFPCANAQPCASPQLMVENGLPGTFLGKLVLPPPIALAANQPEPEPKPVTSDSTAATKHIYIDLNKQTIYAFEGSTLFLQTLVSTGKWGRTPPGEYEIWAKMRSVRMSGGSGNDAYDLPNVPFDMFFFNQKVVKSRGYALHGAYWHNNFGHEMSHGCVNLRPIDAEKLYNWASPTAQGTTTYASQDDPGTKITICDQIVFATGQDPQCLE